MVEDIKFQKVHIVWARDGDYLGTFVDEGLAKGFCDEHDGKIITVYPHEVKLIIGDKETP